MRLLVVGAGSTGGYFGARLAQAGRDVTFLVRPRRAEALRRDGLQIVSPHYGDLTIQPALVTADAVGGPYDAVLLAVKAYALEPAMVDMAPAVGPATVILPVLNGMRHMDVLAERFGEARLGGCACKIATTVDEAGRIVQLAPMHELDYGERDGSASDRIAALDGFMQGAGFKAVLSDHIVQDMWEKWTMLAAVGAVTCLMRGNAGEIEAVPGGTEFVNALLDEVVAVTTAEGHPPRQQFVDQVRTAITQKGSAFASSMYRDLQRGAATEGDQIVGDLAARGQRRGIPVPLLSAAYAGLAIYQNRQAA